MIGKQLGPYKILEPLGAGGMGEVYLGEDTRLGRKVAVKVLPEEFAADPERLARFEQEARAAAALNHPHIAVLHDIGFEPGVSTSGGEPGEGGEPAASGAGAPVAGTHYMVQEFLDGDTLRAPLDRGALGAKKSLKLAAQIASALAAAHAAGIVHRDLKPENIFVTKEGHAKVLDFGLAKLTEFAPAMSPGTQASKSPTLLGTVAGQVMGTAGYMAPEQVHGDGDIDQRADLFACGCVLYEMLTGRRAFSGKNVFETLSRIVDEQPSRIAEADATLPAQLQWVVDKCLAKDPADRYQSAADLAVDVRRLAADIDSGALAPVRAGATDGGADGRAEGAAATPAPAAGVPWKLAVPAALALIALAAAAWLLRPAPETPVVKRFFIDYPINEVPAGASRGVALSPDGRWIAFHSGGQLWLRGIGDFEATPIRGSEGRSRTPVFSPDSQDLAFWIDGQIMRAAVSGGAPVALTDAPGRWLNGLDWAADGHLYYGISLDHQLLRVSETGGTPEVVADGETQEVSASQLLPGNEWVLFSLGNDNFTDARVVAQSLLTGERKLLVEGGYDGRYLPSGHLLYYLDGNLLAVRFDLERVEVIGGPVVIVEGVNGTRSGAADYGVSTRGDLVYRPGSGTGAGGVVLNWIDRDGGVERLRFEPRAFDWPNVSRDGAYVATQIADADGTDVWVYEIARGAAQRLTSTGDNQRPVWSADGEWVYFASSRGNDRDIWRRRADLIGEAEVVLEMEGEQYPNSISADGSLLLFESRGGESNSGEPDLYLMDLDGDPSTRPVVATPAVEQFGSLSPDGRFAAYASNESGESRIYVREIASGRQWPVSTGLTFFPTWSPAGDEIIFRTAPGRVLSAPVTTNPEFSVGEPREIAQLTTGNRGNFTLSHDGQRILFFASPDESDTGEPVNTFRVAVVLNWIEELKARVPVEGSGAPSR